MAGWKERGEKKNLIERTSFPKAEFTCSRNDNSHNTERRKVETGTGRDKVPIVLSHYITKGDDEQAHDGFYR